MIRLAVKLGIEYIDLELTWSAPLLNNLVKDKGYSKIIASHHDITGNLKWDAAVWEDYYQRALTVGDIIKFVGTAKSVEDNLLLENFRSIHTRKPLIAINMTEAGRMSRVLNKVLTPVTHESFPVKAAPGQLSVKEINEIAHIIGGLPAKEFMVVGNPVSHSRSLPTQCMLQGLESPHNYTFLKPKAPKSFW